jgi:DNA-binding NtrC family response regulator
MLMTYHWPGNVRELQNIIERSAVISEDGYIEAAHLPVQISGPFDTQAGCVPNLPSGLSLDDRLAEIEKSLIIDALRKTGGVQVRATELLGINQRSLWHRIKKHNIDVKSIKSGNQ